MDARIGIEELHEHAAALRRLARRLAHDGADADDLVQDTWLRAVEKPPRNSQSLRAWLRAVLVNRHREVNRTAALRREHEQGAHREDREVGDRSEDLEERLRLQSSLARALLELPEPNRTAVTLRYLDGLSGAEVARLQGISHDALRQRLARGIALLRERLDRDLGSRRAWTLLALARPKPHLAAPLPAAFLAVTAMSTTAKIASAAVFFVIAVLSVALWMRDGAVAPDKARLATSESPRLDVPSSGGTSEAGAGDSRAVLLAGSDGDATLLIDRERDLFGMVVDPNGAPIPGALVRIERCESSGWPAGANHGVLVELYTPVHHTTSAADGTFAIPLARGRPFDLFVDAIGFAPSHLAQRHAGEHVVVHMGASGALDVHVVRADGSPLAAGKVIVDSSPEDAPDEGWTIQSADLDSQGRAHFEGLPGRGLGLWIAPADSTWPVMTDANIVPGVTTSVEITLPRGDEVRGRVIDARTKAPVPGARVGAPAWFGSGVKCDLDGAFVVPAMSPDFGNLHVDAPGYAHASVNVRDGHDNVTSPVTIELQPERRVIGRVVDESGAPVADAYVAATGIAWRDRFMQSDWLAARTDNEGSFTIERLSPELAHAIFARKDGFGTATFDLPAYEIDSDLVQVGDIVLRKGALLTGRVLDAEGVPIPGARVALTGTNADRGALPGAAKAAIDPAPSERHARADDLGRFSFADVAAGEWTVHASGDDDHRPSDPVDVRIVADETHDALDLRCGAALSIRGRVLGPDGKPIAGRIMVVPVGPHERSRGAEVSEDGTFLAVPLDPGLHDLVVNPTGTSAAPLIVRVEAGRADVVIRLPEREFVRGRVLDPEGNPNAGAWVSLVDPSCDQVIWSGESKADGTFELALGRGARAQLRAVSRRAADGTKMHGEVNDVPAGAAQDVKLERGP